MYDYARQNASDAEVTEAFNALAFSPPADATMEEALRLAREFMATYGNPDVGKATAGVTIRQISANGVPCDYITAAKGDQRRRIVYLHGGGWMMGSPASYRALGAELAKASRCAVLMVDYRLAPEHPYPAGLDDCVAACRWAFENGPDDKSAASAVFVAGDSAGGNLAAATTMRIGKDGDLAVDALVCISAMLDVQPTDFRARRDDLCTPATVQSSVMGYLQGQFSDKDPLISCGQASLEMLAGFPPTLLQVSADEFFLECNENIANKLMSAGVRTVLSVWPRMPHVWHQFIDLLPEAKRALVEIGAFLEDQGRNRHR